MPSSTNIDAGDVLEVLARRRCWEVARIVGAAGPAGLAAGAIAAGIGATLPATSNYVGEMVAAYILRRERVGRSALYFVVHDALTALADEIASVAAASRGSQSEEYRSVQSTSR